MLIELPPKPEGYVPPQSADELLARYARGERYLFAAECEGADLSCCNLSGAHLGTADFRGARLDGADISQSFLGHARFFGASLQGARLREVRTMETYFNGADLRGADFRDAELVKTEFIEACLIQTNFRNAMIVGSDFGEAWFAFTDLTAVDLSSSNLHGAVVKAACLVSLDTLHATGLGFGKATGASLDVGFEPNAEHAMTFLTAAGVSAEHRDLFRKWVAAPREFRSVFISYSHRDKAFASSLRASLTAFRVPCWMDEWDLYPGETILDALSKAIGSHDRVLLCCSAASLTSSWIEDEIAMAIEKERDSKENVLVPIDLDGFLFEGWRSGSATRVRTRLAASFRGLRDVTENLPELTRLVASLKLR